MTIASTLLRFPGLLPQLVQLNQDTDGCYEVRVTDSRQRDHCAHRSADYAKARAAYQREVDRLLGAD